MRSEAEFSGSSGGSGEIRDPPVGCESTIPIVFEGKSTSRVGEARPSTYTELQGLRSINSKVVSGAHVKTPTEATPLAEQRRKVGFYKRESYLSGGGRDGGPSYIRYAITRTVLQDLQSRNTRMKMMQMMLRRQNWRSRRRWMVVGRVVRRRILCFGCFEIKNALLGCFVTRSTQIVIFTQKTHIVRKTYSELTILVFSRLFLVFALLLTCGYYPDGARGATESTVVDRLLRRGISSCCLSQRLPRK